VSKIIDIGTKQKRVCDFLLVINSNLGSTLRRFAVKVTSSSKMASFLDPLIICIHGLILFDEKLDSWVYRSFVI